MQVIPGRLRLLATTAAALALIAGCSSSNNNSNTNKSAVNTAATIAAQPRTPSPAPTVARTPTPAPTVARTATPSAAAPVRTASPAISQIRTATPAAGAAVADTALQAAFASAALKPTDFPTGYTATGPADTSLNLPDESASYQATYVKVALPDLGLVINGLLGFKDTASAQADFKNLQNLLQSQDPTVNLKLTPQTTSAKIGDETQVYGVSLNIQGQAFTGYVVAWRRGRVGGDIILAGSGAEAPKSADSTVALAQKQDTTLQAVKQ